jgi:Neuraminidase (sialidase)
VVAVPVVDPDDFLDKEWLFVDQRTGELYLSYVRFGADGSTPLELVRSKTGGATWEGPFVIVPNLLDTFNSASQPIVTPTGRVIVTYNARTFSAGGLGPESDDRIEAAYSDDDGTTWSAPVVIAHVNPQGEPPGYNRGRRSILNTPYINFDPNNGFVYVTYFNGKTPLTLPNGIVFTGPLASAADILLSRSRTNGTTWDPPVKVNDDAGVTSHVFPSVQVNKNSWVFVGWNDRRNDPSNEFTDTWANVSHDFGGTFGHDIVQTDVATSWRVRADARPNFGDYNSSELLGFNQFVLTWADGRFLPPGGQTATPDTIFTIANGLGVAPPK